MRREMKPAMLVIDMQKDFFNRKIPKKDKEYLLVKTCELLNIFWGYQLPVIHLITRFRKDKRDVMPHMRHRNDYFCIEKTEGCQELEEVRARENERVIIKKRYSGFYRTSLDRELKALDITALILTGIFTHACVQMTAIDAYQRSYEVMIAEECILSHEKTYHKAATPFLRKGIARFMKNEEIGAFLKMVV